MSEKKDVQITGQRLMFSSAPKVEPEQQAAVREFSVAAPAGFQQSGEAGASNTQGNIPTIVRYESTAGEMAQARMSACTACKHWDNRALQKYVALSTGPLATPEQKQTIQTMKARIMLKGSGYMKDDGSLDVDGTLASFGICRVLSEWVKGVVGEDPMYWPIVTQPEANCPPSCHAKASALQVVTDAQPLGLFVPKDLDAKKVGAKRYDEVLRLAQGKKP